MADIFLSYDSQDRDRVRSLVDAFERQGWSVWWDRRIPPGQTWHQAIQTALDAAKCVVVVWSQHSIKSDWVIVEAEEGKSRGLLIPVLLDDVRLPLSFRLIQAARLVDWQGAATHPEWMFLLDTIKTIIGAYKPPSTPPAPRNDVTPAPPTERPRQAQSPRRLFQTRFTVMTLDARGKIVERRASTGNYYPQDLGGNVWLELAELPGGTFLMGSPTEEAGRADDESPQRRVTVAPFLMGKFTVTQAQWRAVAGWPKVKLDLHPEPAYFQGDALPVEQVSWIEATEFCARLSRKTGKHYRLPSEAEWEYAARAGTTTPFAFGETITPEIVNYDGNYPYAAAPPGAYRAQTIAVGSLGVANAFGLFDMHGNVSEWCQDNWHHGYEGAPVDGAAWLRDGDDSRRVLRGGSWHDDGRYCRAANRHWLAPEGRDHYLGFRVVLATPVADSAKTE
jgi:formylglycine-generating enzyme required for sulfatase activity